MTNEERPSAPAMPVQIVVQHADTPAPSEPGAIDALASWLRAAGASWRVALPCAALAIVAATIVGLMRADEREYQLLVFPGASQASTDLTAADLGAWVVSQAPLSEFVSVQVEAPARDSRLLRFRLLVRAAASGESAAELAAAEALHIEGLIREAAHPAANETRAKLEEAITSYRRSIDQLRQDAAQPRPGTVVDVAAIQRREVELQDKIREAESSLRSIDAVRTRLDATARGADRASPVRFAATALAAGLAGAVVGALADAFRRRMMSSAA